MSLYSYYRISKPSEDKVPAEKVNSMYYRTRNRTFWGATAAYALYYVCRMTMGIVKQPLIDEGIFTTSQLGIIGSAMLFVYAFGKFFNGFIADYCNIKRFMATGLLASTVINLIMGVLGLMHGWLGMTSVVIFIAFAIFWGLNGYAQSMGAPPGVISLSRWFPLSKRGTFYSIFSATPYLGKSLSMILIGLVVSKIGWEYGFIFAALAGLAGACLIIFMVSDTPESCGLPSIQEISGEAPKKADSMPTSQLQKIVVKNPGIWIIALSSAFVYITQYAVSNWGVLFLQKGKGFSLTSGSTIIAVAEAFGIAGTLLAGWLSDTVFKGNRIMPVLLSGLVCLAALSGFTFTRGSYFMNILYIAVFSLAIGVVYCVVAGLMALDIVPRKATGAALGLVGISSYVAAGIQDIVSGFLIKTPAEGMPYDFTSVGWFWVISCLLCFLIPVLSWNHLRIED